jgi:hypothetical protein
MNPATPVIRNRHWPVRHDGAPTGAVLLLNTHACFMLLFLPMTFSDA